MSHPTARRRSPPRWPDDRSTAFGSATAALRAVLACIWLGTSAIAIAATATGDPGTAAIYRCGSTYTQQPCGEGRALALDDGRGAAQRAEAERVARGERRLADTMERDRLKQQAALRPTAAGRLDRPAPVAASPIAHDSRRSKRRTDAPPRTGDFTAYDPTSVKSRGR